MFRYVLTWVLSKLPISDERGQDLIEYSMLGGLIALAIIAVVVFLTGSIESMAAGIGRCIDFNSVTTCDPF